MNYAEVLQRVISSKCKWEIETGGMIIGHREDMPGKVFDPITAVCFEFAGVYYKPSEVRRAAETIGMPSEFVTLFSDANDFLGMSAAPRYADGGRVFFSQGNDAKTQRLLKIRNDILRFTKLEEAEDRRLERKGMRKLKTKKPFA